MGELEPSRFHDVEEQLREAVALRDAAQRRIHVEEQRMRDRTAGDREVVRDADTTIRHIVSGVLDVAPWQVDATSGGCPDSPVGGCVYNLDDDPCRDDCLFCRQPHERK